MCFVAGEFCVDESAAVLDDELDFGELEFCGCLCVVADEFCVDELADVLDGDDQDDDVDEEVVDEDDDLRLRLFFFRS